MILRDIYLYFNELHFPLGTNLPRDTESRWLCNYLERKIQSPRFATENFRRFIVCGMEGPLPDCHLVDTGVLTVFVPFFLKEYRSLSKSEIPEYYIGLLEAGFAKCNKQYPLPMDRLREGIEEFRAGGYVNQWTWKKKVVKELGIKVAFDCEMTIDRFTMQLNVYRQNELVLTDPVFEFPPDEIIFGSRMKRLEIDGSEVRILKTSGNPSYHIDLAGQV